MRNHDDMKQRVTFCSIANFWLMLGASSTLFSKDPLICQGDTYSFNPKEQRLLNLWYTSKKGKKQKK